MLIFLANSALRLKAILDFTDLVKVEEKKVEEKKSMLHMNGYLKDLYIPRTEVAIDEQIKATVLKANQAIRLRARKECKD